MIKKIVQFLESLLTLNKAAESLAVDVLASYAPWLAPLSTAFMVYQALVNRLEYPAWVAMATSIAVEVLGLSSVQTILSFSAWNRETGKTAPKAPVFFAIVAGVLYLSVVMVLIVLLDPAGTTEKLAKGVLALLSVSAAFVISLRAAQSKRAADWKQEKQERKLTQLAPHNTQLAPRPDWRLLTDEQRQKITGLSVAEIMTTFRVKERTAQYYHARAKESQPIIENHLQFSENDL